MEESFFLMAGAEMENLPLGLLVELVTPVTTSGTLAIPELQKLVARVIPEAAGLVAGTPLVGEGLALAPATRLALFQELLPLLPSHLPLFFCLTAATAAGTRKLAGELEGIWRGHPQTPPVFWVDLPLMYHSNRGLPQFYQELSAILTRPLILMNQPRSVRAVRRPLHHANLRTAVLKKLTVLPAIRGLIYQGSMRRFLHYHAAAVNRSEFWFYEADEQRFLTRPGAGGLVSATALLFPRTWKRLVQACLFLAEDQEATPEQLWEWGQIVQQLVQACQPAPAALVKKALQHLGVLDQATLWPGTPPATPKQVKSFLALVAEGQRCLPG